MDDRLPGLLGCPGREALRGERVQELAQAFDLLRGCAPLQQRELDRLRNAEVRRGSRPEPVGIPLAGRRLQRRDDRVAEDRQRPPLGVREQIARRQGAERLADLQRDRGGVREHVGLASRGVAGGHQQRLAPGVLADPIGPVPRSQP